MKTKRIYIRKIKKKDLKDVYEISKSNIVGPSAGWLPHKSIEDTKMFLNYSIKQNDLYAIVLNETKKVIGMISFLNLSIYKNDLEKTYELGYVLNEKYWNLGYMSEAIKIFINYAFNKLKVNKIISSHTKENIASKKILLNNNFKFTHIDNNPMFEVKEIKQVYMYELINERNESNEI